MKTCTRCLEAKPPEAFHPKRVVCRVCVAAERRAKYQADPAMRAQAQEAARKQRERIDTHSPEYLAKMREYSQRYSQTERGKQTNRERRKRNYHANPRLREYQREYYKRRYHENAEYRERQRTYQNRTMQRWRVRNPEKAQAHDRKQHNRIANTPELRAKYTEYERTHRQARQQIDPAYHEHLMELAKSGQHKRRARLAGSGGNHTIAEWRALCAKYDHRCLCCGLVKPLTRDHIIPLEPVNGTPPGDNSIDNIQPLCRPCNSAKGNRRTTDYRPKP